MSKSAARRKRNQQHSGQRTSQGSQSVPKPKPPAAKQAPARKVHGTFLTAILVWIALDGLLSLILIFAFKKDPGSALPPSWLIGLGVLVALAEIGSAVALWYWKRWGLYLLLAATIASAALGIVIFYPTPAMVVALHAFIPLAILGYVLSYQKKMPLLV